MAHALLQTLELGAVEVVLQDGLVVRVGALVDDNAGTLARTEAADVGKTLVAMLVRHRYKYTVIEKRTCSVTITSRSCSV